MSLDLLSFSGILCVLRCVALEDMETLKLPGSRLLRSAVSSFRSCFNAIYRVCLCIVRVFSAILCFCSTVVCLVFRPIFCVYQWFFSQTLYCQVECYGQGQIHHNIMKKLNIIEKPGAPLVLFVYKVSRETEDLRNALQWIEGSQRRRRDDICTVILLEKSSDKQKVSVEVAHQGTFADKTVVVRILWEQQWNSSAKIHHSPNNRVAMAKVKKRIMECKVEKTFQSKPQ